MHTRGVVRIALVAIALGVLAAPLAAAASVSQRDEASATVTASHPTLHLVSANPLVVAGTGFESRERVTLTALTTLGPRIQKTRATSAGRFRAQLGSFSQPCGKPFAVRARGIGGSLATLHLEAPPCVPPPRG
jgi:hypothetical protein